MLNRAPLLSVMLALLLALPAGALAQENDSWLDKREEKNGGASVTVGASAGGRPGGTSTVGWDGGGCPDAPGGACTDAAGNWWSGSIGCYLEPATDWATPGDAAAHPGETPWRCAGPGFAPRIFWLTAAAAPGPDPAVLAQRAVDSMRLQAVAVGLAPPPGSPNPTLVGIPTWMWVDRPTSTTFGPATATASAGGVTVTATATVSGVTWDMGDGTRVECGKGTPYSPGYGGRPSPDCGHTYRRAGDYTVAATSHWAVDWTGAGRSGRITLDLTGTAGIRVAEAYGLVVGQG